MLTVWMKKQKNVKSLFRDGRVQLSTVTGYKFQMSQYMRFPTMWYARPAKHQVSLRIRAV